MAIVLVEAETAANDSLANQIVAVGEAPNDSAALKFIGNLRITRRIIVINKIVGCNATNGLGNAITVTVVSVSVSDTTAVEIGQTVLEIVSVGAAVRRGG
jgi:hypothetical protein